MQMQYKAQSGSHSLDAEKGTLQTPFHAMVYQRFLDHEFRCKVKTPGHAICEPRFAGLDFLLTQVERKNALFAKRMMELLCLVWTIRVEVIRRGSLVVGERASVGRVDERHNQAQHLGDSRFSFPTVDNASDQCWQSSRAWPQTVVGKVEY